MSFSWALNCCGRNRELAEDVLQTSYLKILEGKASFDGRSAFKTFLFAVIRRTAAEWRRGTLLSALGISRWSAARPVLPAAPDPERAAQAAQRHEVLRTALAKLPRRQQQVLELVFAHDLTVEQAAVTLGISAGSARVHYDRGKKRLARELSGGGR
jgi:RNA polymerase sigma-70 factor (ECF subfamily)